MLKVNNEVCRFNFGRCFSKGTVVVEPLPVHMSKDEKSLVLKKVKRVLEYLKDYETGVQWSS